MIDATTLLLGLPLMDEQHAALVELFNLLEKPESDLAKLGPAFGSYAFFHFEEEEKLMRQYGDPAIEAHIAEHRAYIDTFERMMKESLEGPAARDAMQTYVANWLSQHILGTDKALVGFLSRAGYVSRR